MPTKSRLPDVQIPDVDIWGFLFERNTGFPESKNIYTDPVAQRSYTYADVKSGSVNFGQGLRERLNWKKHDVLLLYTPNSIDTPIVTWGAHWAAGIVSPANPAYTSEELAFQLKDCGARAIVTQKALLSRACAAASKLGFQNTQIILIGEPDPDGVFSHFTDICELGSRTACERPSARGGSPKSDLSFLVYSSGTTGHPKGVMLSHENVISNILMLNAGEGVHLSWKAGKNKIEDRILGFLPFYHIYGLTSLVHQALFQGIELIVMAKYDLPRFCSYVQEYKVTLAYVVPPVLLQLAKERIVKDFDLRSLRMLSSGAAPLTRELVDAAYRHLKVPIKQGYGLSEMSPTTHSQPWHTWQQYIGSVGVLLPNQTIKYVSDNGTELPVGETGEIWVKGPNVFQGYLNNTKATQSALTEDGYFKTGDVGYEDKNGNLYITDRLKELIKFKGFQVPPAELEGVLLSHPDVNDAAVIGVYKADEATEVPMAFIVLAQGKQGTQEKAIEISKWLNARLAYHKHLRGGIRWIDVIPKSPSGKILRRMLKQQHLELKSLKAML